VHDVVELRSDTFTLPSPAMRDAMARAEVGDDVYEEDPTVRRLEARAARQTGKEAGLLVTSGTQGNLVAILAQTQPGQEILLDADCHVFTSEVGGAARLGGLQTRPLATERGFLSPRQVRESVRGANIHLPVTGLVCIENTHNRHGGTCSTPEEIAAVAEAAHAAGVPVHLDGARLFNAAVALKRPAEDFTRHVDSLTFCLSKGLGAPVGSLICGSHSVIAQARRVRKMIGGGMRQAGVLAAAGLVAMETGIDRLAEDHARARQLAESLLGLPGLTLDLATVETNIVRFQVATAERATELVAGCAARKIKVHHAGPTSIRCVTHKDVDSEDIRRALDAFREITAAWR
jgi:threonine aldolase